MKSCLTYLLILGAVWSTSGAAPQRGQAASPSPEPAVIERALLAHDWNTVLKECGPTERISTQPVLRLLKGHACLALNRNNESVALFLAVTTAPDRHVWQEWCEGFLQRSGQRPMAYYLLGDAEARLGRWSAAVRAYDAGLKLAVGAAAPSAAPKQERGKAQPGGAGTPPGVPALLYNARGVAHAGQGELTQAVDDFETATALAPSFCDAYINLGSALVLLESPDGAKAAFSAALKISPACALAFNGRACVALGQKKFDQALSDLQKVKQCPALAELAQHNLEQLIDSGLKAVDAGIAAQAPGSTIKSIFNTVKSAAQAAAPNKFTAGIEAKGNVGIGSVKFNFQGEWQKRMESTGAKLQAQTQQPARVTAPSQVRNTAPTQPPPGGASTKEIAQTTVDTGRWTAVTWFGLAQQAVIPQHRAESRKGGSK